MSIDEFAQRGYSVVSEYRCKVDERGIDGSIVLFKKRYGAGPKLYIAAHYRVGNMYGEPLPLPHEK